MTWLIGAGFLVILGLGVARALAVFPPARKATVDEPVAEAPETPAPEVVKPTSVVIESKDIDMGGPKSTGDPDKDMVDWIREIGGSGFVQSNLMSAPTFFHNPRKFGPCRDDEVFCARQADEECAAAVHHCVKLWVFGGQFCRDIAGQQRTCLRRVGAAGICRAHGYLRHLPRWH